MTHPHGKNVQHNPTRNKVGVANKSAVPINAAEIAKEIEAINTRLSGIVGTFDEFLKNTTEKLKAHVNACVEDAIANLAAVPEKMTNDARNEELSSERTTLDEVKQRATTQSTTMLNELKDSRIKDLHDKVETVNRRSSNNERTSVAARGAHSELSADCFNTRIAEIKERFELQVNELGRYLQAQINSLNEERVANSSRVQELMETRLPIEVLEKYQPKILILNERIKVLHEELFDLTGDEIYQQCPDDRDLVMNWYRTEIIAKEIYVKRLEREKQQQRRSTTTSKRF